MNEIINDYMKYSVTEGDMVRIHKSNWDFSKRIGEPYKAIVLWCGINNQPLITNIDEYNPRWVTYKDIVEIVGHVDLENLFRFDELKKQKEK